MRCLERSRIQTAPDSSNDPNFFPESGAMTTSSFSIPFRAYRRRSDVKPDPEVAPGFEFDFESEPLCRVQLKQMILQEVNFTFMSFSTLSCFVVFWVAPLRVVED